LPTAVLISGTLKPLTIAINGQKILSQENEDESIFLNGQELKSEKNDRHRSFFFKTNEDHFEIRNSKKEVLLNVQMPILEELESRKNIFTAVLSSAGLVLKLDDRIFPGGEISRNIFESGEASQANDPWFQEEHTLVLVDPVTKLERLYVFEATYDVPARRMQRVGLEVGDPGISSEKVALGINFFYDRIFANRIVVGGRLSLSWPRTDFYRPSNGYLAQGRVGYQIFRKSNQLHSPVWLEAGVGFEFVGYSEFRYLGEEKFNFQVPFFYVYTQPLVVGDYQFGFALQGGPRAAQSVPNFLTTLFIAREW
jgi:hypothetical protein